MPPTSAAPEQEKINLDERVLFSDMSISWFLFVRMMATSRMASACPQNVRPYPKIRENQSAWACRFQLKDAEQGERLLKAA
jgi:hypothetical protein